MPRAGSVSGRLISDAELGLLPFSAVVVNRLLFQASCPRTSRYRISVADIAIFLMLFNCFSDNMNADDSLPWVRFHALWTKLFQAGEVDRPVNGERFKDIRNWLSGLGYIDWDDGTYWYGPVKGQGQAARWQASTGLLLLLQPRKAAGRERGQEPVRVHIRDRGASLSVTPVITDPHYKRPRLRLRQAEWLEMACEYERLYGQAA